MDTIEYWHRGVDTAKRYTYVVAAVNEVGQEGNPAVTTIQGSHEKKKDVHLFKMKLSYLKHVIYYGASPFLAFYAVHRFYPACKSFWCR